MRAVQRHIGMRRVVKVALMVLTVPVAVLAWFAPNIHGYYRFQEICEKEGGLRIYGKLRKGEGWLADKYGRYDPASFEGVPFVRKPDSQGRVVDYKFKGGRPGDDRSYEATPADPSIAVAYQIKTVVRQPVPGELRLDRSGYEVSDVSTGQLLVRWYQFSYSRFDQNRTVLAAPSGVYCHLSNGFFEPANYQSYFEH